jgi:hypothetical protein
MSSGQGLWPTATLAEFIALASVTVHSSALSHRCQYAVTAVPA